MLKRFSGFLAVCGLLMLATGARAATYTQVLIANFGVGYTGQATNIRVTIFDNAGTTQIAATNTPSGNAFAESTDAAAGATTGTYISRCTVDTSWLPIHVKYTITGQTGIATSTVIGSDRAASLADGFSATVAGRVDAAISSRMASGNVTVGGYAVNQDPETLILGATAATWNTAGTIGNKINSAASAGDPWSTLLPGSYGAGTAGYILGTGVNINLLQALSTSNTGDTVGGGLIAARAQAFGKYTLVGTTLTLYAADGVTVLRTFTLDSVTNPHSRN